METKKWYDSMTIKGQIITALSLMVNILNYYYGISLIGNEDLTTFVSVIFTLVGVVMGIRGRVRAITRLSL